MNYQRLHDKFMRVLIALLGAPLLLAQTPPPSPEAPSVVILRGNSQIHLHARPGISRLGVNVTQSPTGDICVARVETGSEADRIGVRPGDCIIAINDVPVTTPEDIARELGARAVLDPARREGQPLPLLGRPTALPLPPGGGGPQLFGFEIVCAKAACQVDAALKDLKPFRTYQPILVGINGHYFQVAAERQINSYLQQLNRVLAVPSSRPLVLTIVLNTMGSARDETIYEITFDPWTGGALATTPLYTNFMGQPTLVTVSPDSFVDSVRSFARTGDRESTALLLASAKLLYSKAGLISQMNDAIGQAISLAVDDRLKRARQSRSMGDWSQYSITLTETLVTFPESKQQIETLLLGDVEDGRQALNTGDSTRALEVANRARAVLPDLAPAVALQTEATTQVATRALAEARASASAGDDDQAQTILVAALKTIPDRQELQSELAEVHRKLELADRQKAAQAQQAAEREAAGRRAADLAELAGACRSTLDRKDYSAASYHCGTLNSAYPEESVTKILMARLRAVTPAPTRGTAEAGTRTAPPTTSSRSKFGAPSLMSENSGQIMQKMLHGLAYQNSEQARVIQQAISSIGESYDDLLKKFKDQGAQAAFSDVFKGIAATLDSADSAGQDTDKINTGSWNRRYREESFEDCLVRARTFPSYDEWLLLWQRFMRSLIAKGASEEDIREAQAWLRKEPYPGNAQQAVGHKILRDTCKSSY